jgi:hypothetical protein
LTKSTVFTYIANPNASPNLIDANDPKFIADILSTIGKVERLTLILNSPGGVGDVVDKLATVCRSHCDRFSVIVPNFAKSAATMWALSSDEILMGYLSELGPIDPQILVFTPEGRPSFMPASSILGGISVLHQLISQGADPRLVAALAQKVSVSQLDFCTKAIESAKAIAETWLSRHMLKTDTARAKTIAQDLCDYNKWLSHGKMIDRGRAKEMGLNVVFLEREDELWKCTWEYYLRAEFMLNATGQLRTYETRWNGINLGAQVRRPPGQAQPE